MIGRTAFVLPCLLSSLTLALSLLGPRGASAQPEDALDGSIERAAAVIEGEVIRLETESIDWTPAGRRVPFTRVTYRVHESFKGAHGSEVTLRFIGGPTEDGRLVMRVSDVPQFEVGDRDFLFVGEEPRSSRAVPRICPLVRCQEGRLRLRDGLVRGVAGAPIAPERAISPQALRARLRERVRATAMRRGPVLQAPESTERRIR